MPFNKGASYLRDEVWKNSAYMREPVLQESAGKFYNEVMRLSLLPKQREIIIGTILGDGCLEFNRCKGTRLQVKQSEKHKYYVFWLYGELSNLCKSAPKRKKDTGQWYFSTRHIDELTNIQEVFYREGRKILPANIEEMLKSSLSLAVWYMDDGKLDFIPRVHCSPYLCTDNFSFKEVDKLVEVLNNNFGVKANLQNYFLRYKVYPRIYIKAVTRQRFFSIIEKHILKCFFYKLPPK